MELVERNKKINHYFVENRHKKNRLFWSVLSFYFGGPEGLGSAEHNKSGAFDEIDYIANITMLYTAFSCNLKMFDILPGRRECVRLGDELPRNPALVACDVKR